MNTKAWTCQAAAVRSELLETAWDLCSARQPYHTAASSFVQEHQSTLWATQCLLPAASCYAGTFHTHTHTHTASPPGCPQRSAPPAWVTLVPCPVSSWRCSPEGTCCLSWSSTTVTSWCGSAILQPSYLKEETKAISIRQILEPCWCVPCNHLSHVPGASSAKQRAESCRLPLQPQQEGSCFVSFS